VRRVAALTVALLAAITLASCGDDLGRGGVTQGSCSDFATQAEAQQAANTADGDRDGRYCERLPCPCLGPDGKPETPAGKGEVQTDERAERDTGERSVRRGHPERSAVTQPATITHVVDGDTVDARLVSDGRRVRVRLLGIDTPEKTGLRAGRPECGGQDATRFTESLARRWRDVVLVTDPSQDAEDKYGRLLAYIDAAMDPGRSYQAELLSQGWAKVYVLDGRPIDRLGAFRGAAASAQRERRGVWRSCGGDFRRPLPG
jgi:micrococcal nuclease